MRCQACMRGRGQFFVKDGYLCYSCAQTALGLERDEPIPGALTPVEKPSREDS